MNNSLSPDLYRIARRRVQARFGVALHGLAVGGVSLMLAGLDAWTTPGLQWVGYPALGMALGLGLHARLYALAVSDWLERGVAAEVRRLTVAQAGSDKGAS